MPRKDGSCISREADGQEGDNLKMGINRPGVLVV